jgi:endonuclease-3
MTNTERSQINPNTGLVFSTLKHTYPHAKIILTYHTPWELLVAVILSAQCTDVTVNKVTEKLFAKYKTLDAYVGANLTEFEKDIKSTGFYHTKAKNVLAAAKLIQTKFKGTVPKTMEEMLTIPGVARKTANVVLGNAYGVVVGIAVDTHVSRVSQRLRLVDLTKIGGKKLMIFERDGKVFIDYTKDADPVKIEQELMALIPKKDWFALTYLLIDHGRARCRAQNPNCAACEVNKFCPSSRLQG